MSQTQKKKQAPKKKARKSKIKKAKVYIPAYKIIISCAVIITICMGLLLFTTIKVPSSENSVSLSEEFTEKTEDKKADEKPASTSKTQDDKKPAAKKTNTEKQAPQEKKKPAPAKSPAKAPAPTQTPAKNPAPAKAPAPSKTPAPAPEKTPAKSQEPVPLPAPAPVQTPAREPEKALSKFNFPPAKNGATIVIVIDDAGRSAENTKKYTDLPFPITIAVLPKLPQTKQCAQTVRNACKELILHQPMQAMNLNLNPGEGAIKEEMTRAEITATIRENIAELGPDVKGMNNHEGSLITANEVKIGIVLDTCMDMGIYFLDSRTTAETKAPQAALERDFEIFEKAGPYIDNDIDYDKMLVRLRETLDYANKHGKAIVIGHVDKSVKILPKLLSDTYPEMKAAGYKFATPSMLK
ncbi:MAG: divergent polysaccharide deacetylase family protein [Treponema sp.]|nr:divergent polysaccharide deacetylase family protein [Treponema sp.]